MTHEDRVRDVIEKIVVALGPLDARVVRFGNDRTHESVVGLIHGVLSDRALDSRVLSLALWLANLYPTATLVTEIQAILRERSDVATVAGRALERIASNYDLSLTADVLVNAGLPSSCRIGAAKAVAAWHDVRAGHALRAALRSDRDPLVIAEIIQALAWCELRGSTSGAVGEILPFLGHESPDVRYSGLLALGNLNARAAINEVEALQDDVGVTSFGQSVSVEAMRVMRSFKDGKTISQG